jgi:cation transport regulator ChaC
MFYYFAYGSNMDEEDLRTWCKNKSKPFPKWKLLGTACLENYQLVFNYYSSGRNGGAANLMESHNSKVYGLLFEMNESDRRTIREKEGFPNYYEEITVTVKHRDNSISDVITYKVVKDKEKIEHQKPTKYYMGLILKNARNNKFPDEYTRYLESIETQ